MPVSDATRRLQEAMLQNRIDGASLMDCGAQELNFIVILPALGYKTYYVRSHHAGGYEAAGSGDAPSSAAEDETAGALSLQNGEISVRQVLILCGP